MLNFSSVDVEKMAMDDIADESGSYSPLDSLPTSLRNISTESNVLLQAIIKDDVNEMEKQDKTNLVNWSLPGVHEAHKWCQSTQLVELRA